MKQAATILLLFLMVQFASGAAAILAANAANLSSGVPLDASLLLAKPAYYGTSLFVGNILLLLLLYLLKLIRPLRQQGGTSATRRQWPPVLAATTALAVGLSLLLSPFGLSDYGLIAVFDAMKGSLTGMLLLVAVGPATEEVVFREGILRQLSLRGIHPLAAAAASALLFGLVHGNPAQAVPAALLGFAFGMAYAKTDDLWLCVAAHVINNLLGVLSLCFPEAESRLAELPSAATVGAGLLLCGGSAAWLCRWWRREASPTPHIQKTA